MLGFFAFVMSSVEFDPHDYRWYQDGCPPDLGGWGVDDELLTGVLASGTGFEVAMQDSAGACIGYDVALHPTQPPLFLASPAQAPGGWQPYGGADYPFPQTPLDTTHHGFQYPGMIDPNASNMTIARDPRVWGAVSDAPNLCSGSPEALAELHTPFEVAQPHLVPILPRSPPQGTLSPMAHHHGHCESSQPAGGKQQEHQHPQHNFLCAFQRAGAEVPDWERLKHERKRAGRRAVETRHRKKERAGHEKIESTSKRLQDLHANLVAEERALTTEKLALMDQLLRHADCNDNNISEYLLYAAKET